MAAFCADEWGIGADHRADLRLVVQQKLLSLAKFGDIAAEGVHLAGGSGDRTRRVRVAQQTSAWLADVAAANPPRPRDE